MHTREIPQGNLNFAVNGDKQYRKLYMRLRARTLGRSASKAKLTPLQ